MAKMTLTLEELREIVSARLQKYPEITPQPNFVDYLINRAVLELTLVLPDEFRGSLFSTTTEDYTLNQKDYDLPSDLLELRHVMIDDVRAMEYPPQMLQMLESNAFLAPIQEFPIFVRLGTLIRVFPKAASTIANGLKWFYVKTPDEMTEDSDTPDLPGMVHYLVPSAAVEVLSEMLGRPTNEFQLALGRLLARNQIPRSEAEPRRDGRRQQRQVPGPDPITPPID